MSHEEPAAEPPASGPRLFTARYLAEDVLTGGEVVPVRVSMHPPLISLPYEPRGNGPVAGAGAVDGREMGMVEPHLLGLPRRPGHPEDR